MRTWTRDQQNAAWRKWYRENAKRKVAWQRRRRKEMRGWWRDFKSTKSCIKCGESAPECLHFHHRDPTEKEVDLSKIACSGQWSKKRILAEVAKCDVLCANCHMKHHWEERLLSSG
ncbi:MAG TPA: hypothetical protein VFV99_11325 [Kofleriaceae bacterium]|nr:hypothetical protein [Kofleriaceae bacterium]